MLKVLKKTSEKAGLPPGTLVHVGERMTEKVEIKLLDYDEDHLEEKEIIDIQECLPFRDASTVTWINVAGLHRVNIIEEIGNHFHLHPLDICCRSLWHEFQIHARTGMALGIPHHMGLDDWDWDHHAALFQE